MNIVILTGRLTKEPELRYIASTGTPVLSFTLAVNREYSTKKETDFVNCELYGKSAENCANVLTKGFKCGVQGSLRIEPYESQDGSKKSATKIRVNKLEFLESKKDRESKGVNKDFKPSFQPNNEFDGTQEFQSIDDDDLPF